MTDTTQIGGIAGDALRQYIERIERLREEIKALNADVADVYKQAKGHGFDVAVIKEIVKIRSKDQSEVSEFEQILDLYKAAIGMVPATRVHMHDLAAE